MKIVVEIILVVIVYGIGSSLAYQLSLYRQRLLMLQGRQSFIHYDDATVSGIFWMFVLPMLIGSTVWASFFDKQLEKAKALKAEIAELEKEQKLAEKELDKLLNKT